MKSYEGIIVKDYIFKIGKYKGERMSTIAAKDIQYLQWFHTSVEPLPKEYAEKVNEYRKLEQEKEEERIGRSWI